MTPEELALRSKRRILRKQSNKKLIELVIEAERDTADYRAHWKQAEAIFNSNKRETEALHKQRQDALHQETNYLEMKELVIRGMAQAIEAMARTLLDLPYGKRY